MNNISRIMLSVLSVAFIVLAASAQCPLADLNSDCIVEFGDLMIFTQQWLALPGGVNMVDFSLFAAEWMQEGKARVLINEIHYNPDVKTELAEFIELYNAGGVAADLSGWYFSSGISFEFSSPVALAPGEYLVLAQDAAGFNAKFGFSPHGVYAGQLANDGETVRLRDAQGNTVDAVDYKLGFPWPTVGGSPGHSIELANPGLDNDLGGSWRPSDPAANSPPTTLINSRASWKYLEGWSEASSPMSAWREVDFDDNSWPQGNLFIGYGKSFISTVLDMQSNYSSVYLRKEFDVEDLSEIGDLNLDVIYDDGFNAYINGHWVEGDNVWMNELPYSALALAGLENTDWVTFPLPPVSGYLREGKNVLAIHLYNASKYSSPDCFLDVRLQEPQIASSAGPTPGNRNASFSGYIAPQMRQVEHSPKQPQSGDDVTITVKVTDSDGVQAVTLLYQLVDPGGYIELEDAAYATDWTPVAMTDDGTGGDEIPGDDIYTVVLDGSFQQHRRLVRYRIRSSDNTGLSVTAPYWYPYEDEPVPNFAYFVYDGVPDWYGAVQPGSTSVQRYPAESLTRIGVYHLIGKKSSIEASTWTAKYRGSLYNWYGTLVYDGEVYDHIRHRPRGGTHRLKMGKHMWKFDFNRPQHFRARDDYGKQYDTKWDKMNFSACIQQGDFWHRGEQGMIEAAGFKLFNLMGVESPKTHWVHFRIIDELYEDGALNANHGSLTNYTGTQYDGDFWGLYLVIEQMDGRFLDEHNLPDGNFYKIEGHNATSNNQGPTAVTNRSDFTAFKSGYYYSPDPTEQWWRDNVNLDSYYGYRCVVEGIHHGDIGYGKNYFFYLNPETNNWSMLPWDLDLVWANNMYGNGQDPFKSQGQIFARSAINLEYRNRLREFHDLLYNAEQMNQFIDEMAGIIDNPADELSMVDADRAMWDYHWVMVSAASPTYTDNSNKAGQGRFYAGRPASGINIPSPGGFRGMVQLMKNYVVANNKEFDTYSEDPSAPYTPVISYIGEPGNPVNTLLFRTSAFNDPGGSGTFAAMKWRIAEITDETNPTYNPDNRRKYEIETVWETEDLSTFASDIQIPATSVKAGHTYRVRCRMKDNTNRWSHWSSPYQFVAGEPIAEGVLENLRITEVMYNPADLPADSRYDNDDYEFIELKNTGDDPDPLDLTYVSFTSGIDFAFAGSSITSLAAGEFVLVVRNEAAFTSRYPGLTGRIAGEYSTPLDDQKLSNSGETIRLKDTYNGTIAEFGYNDGRGWPISADGAGHSIVPLDSAIADQAGGSCKYGGNWRASMYIHGSPGADDLTPATGVVINEIMAHTDYNNPARPEYDSNDWIELYNTTGSPVTFDGNWYLSDDADDLKQWAIPSGVIGAYGWVSFDEVDGFHNPITSGFGLNKAGEQVFLSYLPGNATDRVVDYVKFKGQANFVSRGRLTDGGAYWFALTPTRDNPNAAAVGSVVINELMYHPVGNKYEYVELYNPTAQTVNLYNSQGPWRLDGAVDYTFGASTSIGPWQKIVVVPFDPQTDTLAFDAFVADYGISITLQANVNIFGPFGGNLSNGSERLSLEKSEAPDLPDTDIPRVIVDEVIYGDYDPWPASPDGTGDALGRLSTDPDVSGNDPTNWQGATYSPATTANMSADISFEDMQDGVTGSYED